MVLAKGRQRRVNQKAEKDKVSHIHISYYILFTMSSFSRVSNKRKQMSIQEDQEEGKGINLNPLRLTKNGRLCGHLRVNIPFGVLSVDGNKLKKNIISIARLQTNKKVDNLPNMKISDTFKSIVFELLQGVLLKNELMQLSQQEQEYINRFIKVSQVSDLEIPKVNMSEQEMKQLLLINLGQIDSQNNSIELKEQTKQILNYLHSQKQLSDTQYHHISIQYKL